MGWLRHTVPFHAVKVRCMSMVACYD